MIRLSPLRLAGLALGLGTLVAVAIACGGGGVNKIGGVRSELVATGADTVTAIAFAPDGRLFFTEQNSGNVRIITADGELLPEPFSHVESHVGLESGLLGIAIDPEFEENHYVYIYYTEPEGPGPEPHLPNPIANPVLMRFTEVDNEGVDPEVLIEFPMTNPVVPVHVGGGLHFGPDGYLYLSIGETEKEELSQDLSSPFGKIMRMTRDGEPAPDNPFVDQAGAGARVYAYGLRNTFGFTFDPESGTLYGADNGPSTCDELNIIEAGGNYGWPDSHSSGEKMCENPGGIDPIYHYAQPGTEPGEIGSNVGPADIEFVSGDMYPSLGDGLLVCEFNTKFMRRLQLAGPDKDQVTDDSVVVEDCGVALASDGSGVIYYSITAEIRRLVPE